MTHRWLRRALLIVFGLAVVVTGLTVWLTRSESGARQLVKLALSQTEADVQIGQVEGSLAKGLSLTEVELKTDSGNVTIERLDVTLSLVEILGKNVRIENMMVGSLVVEIKPVPEGRGSENETIELPSVFQLPVNLLVDHFSMATVYLRQDGRPDQAVLNSLRFGGQWRGTDLVLPDFEISTPVVTLQGALTLTTKAPYATLFSSKADVVLEGFAPIDAAIRASGTLEELDVTLAVEAPYDLAVTGTVNDLINDRRFNLEIATERLELARVNETYPDINVASTIALSGTIDKARVLGKASVSLPELGASTTTFDGTVLPSRIELNSLSAFFSDVDNTATLDSSGVVSWKTADVRADLSLSWDQLQWPLRGEPKVTSKRGKAALKGSLSNYVFSATSMLVTEYDADGSVTLQAAGTSDKVDLHSLRVDALGGQVAGSATVLINEQVSVSAKLAGTEVNPGSIVKDWPGKLAFEVDGSALVADSGFSATLQNFSGEGELRGYPVSFNGSGKVTPGSLLIGDAKIDSGPTKIRLSGTIGETLDVDWSLASSDLESLWPGLSGEVQSKGVASGRREQPELRFSVSAEDLRFEDAFAKTLKANVTYGIEATDSGTADMQVQSVEIGPYSSNSFVLSLNGSRDQHSFELELRDDLGTSRALVEGSLVDDGFYAFDLKTIGLEAKELGTWSLLQPVSARIELPVSGRSNLDLPQTCLTQRSAKLCLGLESVDGVTSADVDLQDLPLSILSHFVPSALKANGNVSGGGQLKIDPNLGSYGSLTFDFDGLELQSRIRKDANKSTLGFAPSVLEANVESTGEIRLNANFPLGSGGGLKVLGTLPPAEKGFLERPVTGRLLLSVPSAAFLADYLPQLSKIEGRLEGEIDVNGSIGQPELLGNLALREGLMTFTGPGVQATDVTLSLAGKPGNTLVVDASAKSGGGNLALIGEINLGSETRTGELTLKGTGFQVLNTQESKLWATPDVALVYNNEQIELTGSVLIPRADVSIDALPKGTVSVSKDQVIVGSTDQNEEASVPVNAELLLSFGDDVHLRAFGLDAFLGGELKLIEQANKPTTATGEVELREGKYQAYGQKLDIATGRLVYAGGPIDQPGVDLRATRVPAAGIEVGVSARGTLSQPQFSVFSTPAMPESDQLAYLIFGRPINADAGSENTLITRLALSLGMQGGEAISQKLANELGVDQFGVESQSGDDLSQASLVIGKYLSPKLFVSYGIGLLEPVSTLKLEYALNSKWQLITESSTTRNSADAQYTYER